MDDYKTIDVEYNNLNNWVETKIKDLSLIKEKIKVFQKNMISLKDDITNIDEVPNGSFGFLNKIMGNFVKNITATLFQFDDLIITPLDNFLFSFKFATSKNINMLQDIKNNLTEEKQQLKNKRDLYFKYIVNNEELKSEKNKNIFFKMLSWGNEDASKKKDENIYNKSVEDNYEQIYQYELDKMNEAIDENNFKYNNIYNEINAISGSYDLTVKEALIKFAKNISNISLNFNSLSSEIFENINSLKELKNEEISNYINKIYTTENEPRFPKQFKEKKENNKQEKSTKKNLFNFFSGHNNNSNNNEININESEQKNEEKKLFIEEISNKLIKNEEIKYKEINELFNILSITYNDSENIYTYFFLNNIKTLYNQRVISLTNKKNFIHLSNLMNHIYIKNKSNNNILNTIIEISQKIKYGNDYLYKIIRKKNEYFGTKTFWIQLIENNLKNDVDIYINNLLENKTEDSNNNNINNNNNISTKNEIKDNQGDLIKNFLNKKVPNFKKLNKPQKNEVVIYSKQRMCFILTKTIGEMCDFQVHEIIISEINRNFDEIFKFDYNMKYYFKMKMIVIKNMKLKNQKKYFSNKEQILNNKLILISNTSKFFPIKKYSSFLKLNKELYPKLRKKIFLNIFSEFNISISSHIKLWYEILEIKAIKNKYNYNTIKSKIGDKKDIPNFLVIDKDVKRTEFIKDNKEHFDKLKNILICFVSIFPEIGYCQGMNYVVTFLYQLLNLNEEETFYFFLGIVLNTKYNQIFKDDFQTLNLFFKIFEKILEINSPEIYYKFLDNNIVTSSYISPLFITLFTDQSPNFKESNPPKFIFFIIEKFILEGWSALFNCGFTLLVFTYEKIMLLEKDNLTSFVINISSVIAKDENFEETKNIFNKNSYFIDEFFVEKLLEITKIELNNKYLAENQN